MNDHIPVLRGSSQRPVLTSRLIQAIAKQFELGEPLRHRDMGGSSNLNVLVEAGGSRHVARVYRHWLTEDRLRDVQQARLSLSKGGVPSPLPIPTSTGDMWCRIGGLLVELESFVERDADMDTWEHLEAGLPWLGHTHNILKLVDHGPAGATAPASNSIDPSNALELTLAGVERIHSWNPTERQREVAGLAEELARALHDLASSSIDLRRQLVHGDFWDNNVFMRHGRVVLVTDLDFMGERLRIDDLALTLYYTNSTFDDDQTSERRAHKLRRLIDAYDSGLDDKLSAAERRSLPLALARTPLAFIAMVANIDTEEAARRHADGMLRDVRWALALVRRFKAWEEIFAG